MATVGASFFFAFYILLNGWKGVKNNSAESIFLKKHMCWSLLVWDGRMIKSWDSHGKLLGDSSWKMVLEIDENENSSVFRGRIHLFMCPPCVSDNPKIQSPRGKKKRLRFFRQGLQTRWISRVKPFQLSPEKDWKVHMFCGEKRGEIWWRLYPCLPRNPFTSKKIWNRFQPSTWQRHRSVLNLLTSSSLKMFVCDWYPVMILVMFTSPKLTCPLKINGWKMKFPVEVVLF